MGLLCEHYFYLKCIVMQICSHFWTNYWPLRFSWMDFYYQRMERMAGNFAIYVHISHKHTHTHMVINVRNVTECFQYDYILLFNGSGHFHIDAVNKVNCQYGNIGSQTKQKKKRLQKFQWLQWTPCNAHSHIWYFIYYKWPLIQDYTQIFFF